MTEWKESTATAFSSCFVTSYHLSSSLEAVGLVDSPPRQAGRPTPMHAEIISVGTELTTGAMLDTNSQWLSLELAAIGIPVHFHTTVADHLDAMAAVLRAAADRSDLS